MPLTSFRSLNVSPPLLPQLPKGPLYGLLAEFDNPTDLVRAVRAARTAGYRKLDQSPGFPRHTHR